MEYQLYKMDVLKGLKARMTKMSIIRTHDDLSSAHNIAGGLSALED